MSAQRRIFATAKTSLIGSRVQPMARSDVEFWRLQREKHPRTENRPSRR
jgi:hypothetical protein